MIRTIWLGFTFLIVLAGVGSFRFAFGNFDAANASGIVRPQVDRIVVPRTVQPAFANVEQPPVTNVPVAPANAEVAKADDDPAELLARLAPAIIATSNVSWHRHEQSTRAIRQTNDQKSRRKNAKSYAIPNKDQAAAEKACQLEDFDAVRWVFNLSTGCFS